MIFRRKIYDRLKEWKSKSAGKSAMMIEGVRRVGKSTVAEHFGKNEYKSYLLIDFTAVPDEILKLFDDISDLDYLFLRLQAFFHVRFYERQTLIVFDEIQFCPKARQAVKHLVADGRYDYIETGSFVSISKNVRSILIPSEEETIEMHPMDFDEFMWAVNGQEDTETLLRGFL